MGLNMDLASCIMKMEVLIRGHGKMEKFMDSVSSIISQVSWHTKATGMRESLMEKVR